MDYFERRRRFWLTIFGLVLLAWAAGFGNEVTAVIVVAVIVLLALVMNGIGGD